MTAYILKSTLSLLILFGLYWFILRKERLLKFNRFYLLASVCFSLLVPFISINIESKAPGLPENVITTFNSYIPEASLLPEVTVPVTIQPSDEGKTLSLSITQILLIIYLSGTILLLSRFLRNLISIYHQIKKSEKMIFPGYQLVLSEHRINPYCFFNSVFVCRQDYDNGTLDNNLLNHELGHIKQYHSADIVFFELVRILYWFNPAIIPYNNAIRLNHEYLADESALGNSGDKELYAGKLLKLTNFKRSIAIASGFNYSLVKKRLIMIGRNKSGILNDLLKIAATMMAGLLLFFVLSCKQKESQDITMQFIPQGQYFSTMINGKDSLNDTVILFNLVPINNEIIDINDGNTSDNAITVGAFLMSNEITNREYREFVNYVKNNPEKLLRQVQYIQDSGYVPETGMQFGATRLIIDFIKYDSIAKNLIDSSALERMNKKYKNYFTRKKYDNYPVTGVSQRQATWFCLWKSDLENEKAEKEGVFKGYNYRLPLEAEWEYAALLADTLMEKSRNNNSLMEADKGTENDYGLFHFSDNVSEWLESHDTPGIIRGGSWMSKGGILERKKIDPEQGNETTGFRIVRSYSPPELQIN
jgi:formylglycine-generating enzyme required for sulfatase activity